MVLMNVCGMNKKPHQQQESTFANKWDELQRA